MLFHVELAADNALAFFEVLINKNKSVGEKILLQGLLDPPLFCPSINSGGIVMRIVTDTRLTLIQLRHCLHVKRKNAMKSNIQKTFGKK